ncbi:MAG: phosphonate C-P lyase system protein PhnH [Alphaproteobacteria bacterium]|nr:phosphonate C-P lyase system protein PhnH [Alphaproteobacteria bacterium]
MTRLAAPATRREIPPGFADPVFDAQSIFRHVLTAMSEPGTIIHIGGELDPPSPLGHASAALALTLMDFETPIWLDGPVAAAASDWVRFHCGAPLTQTESEATFAIMSEAPNCLPLTRFNRGTDEYPEHGATLIIQVVAIEAEGTLSLTGPGIDGSRSIDVIGMPQDFWEQRAQTNSLFPRGVDLILTAAEVAVAIPRTTFVEPM